tara:strand:+ start:146 stop:499 length:354 start_codon:yes stop_codon:yes gene_type:complete
MSLNLAKHHTDPTSRQGAMEMMASDDPAVRQRAIRFLTDTKTIKPKQPPPEPSMSMEEFNELQERQRLREGARAQIVRARESMERQAVRDRLERVRSMREAQKRSKSLGFANHGTYI